MKLIRLPNGTWVSPAAVTAIKPDTSTRHCMEIRKPRVFVMHSGQVEIMNAHDPAEARQMADEIAGKVNAALEEKRPYQRAAKLPKK